MTRPDALAEMLRLYCERMHSNEPVHTWDVDPAYVGVHDR